jgi:hypothetical protein
MAQATRVDLHGYRDCIQLENGHARVVLGHHCGGRVLEYALAGGANVLALDPTQAGWTWDGGEQYIDPWGGRLDIGPEKVVAAHPALWVGAWTASVGDDGTARLVSEVDPATGVQLTREFALAQDSTRLTCTQTIENLGAETHELCHWSRTLVTGGGIAIVPLTEPSRFPHGYVQYDTTEPTINYEPTDPHVVVSDGYAQVIDTPLHPKLGMDSRAGWMAYLLRSDVLFVKRFPVYPDRVYNEIAGLTVSLWCYEDLLCEVEPMGPMQRLAPGDAASFTEDWWLLSYGFPARRDGLDLKDLAARVDREARL